MPTKKRHKSKRKGTGSTTSSSGTKDLIQTKLVLERKSNQKHPPSETQDQAEEGAAPVTSTPPSKPAVSEETTGHPTDKDQQNSQENVVVLDDDDQPESEDDMDTIASDKTSKRGRKAQKKMVCPKVVRYQLMVLMDPKNKDTPIAVDEADATKSPTQRLRDILGTFYLQLLSYDPNARIISWKNETSFSKIGDKFPIEIAEIAKYFNGFRANIKADQRTYLRLCVHTPNSETILFNKMNEWCRLYGYSLTKCIIQAESSTCIGWLCYSSQYTDTDPLKKKLMEVSTFEWGFKLIGVRTNENNLNWMKRLKAIGVYVPTQHSDVASLIIGEELEATLNTSITIPDLTDKFLFVEPEWSMKGNKSKEQYYIDMTERHEAHLAELKAELCYSIRVDLDRRFTFYDALSLSLRDIILDLEINNKRNSLHGEKLFHSVDYVSDSANVWIDNRKGPGGPAVVFTYYEDAANEASTMIRGLGKYVIHHFGKTTASKMFDINHFKANKGYRWDDQVGRFSTPNIRRMKSNIEQDNNLVAIKKLQLKIQKRKEKQKQKELDNLTKEQMIERVHKEYGEAIKESNVITNTTEDIRKMKFRQMLKEKNDPDLQSTGNSSTSRKAPYLINAGDDNSVGSSLTQTTNNSLESIDTAITGSTHGNKKAAGTSVDNPSNFWIDMEMIEVLADGNKETVSDEELRKRVLAMQAHKYNDAVVNTEVLVEKFIDSRRKKQQAQTFHGNDDNTGDGSGAKADGDDIVTLSSEVQRHTSSSKISSAEEVENPSTSPAKNPPSEESSKYGSGSGNSSSSGSSSSSEDSQSTESSNSGDTSSSNNADSFESHEQHLQSTLDNNHILEASDLDESNYPRLNEQQNECFDNDQHSHDDRDLTDDPQVSPKASYDVTEDNRNQLDDKFSQDTESQAGPDNGDKPNDDCTSPPATAPTEVHTLSTTGQDTSSSSSNNVNQQGQPKEDPGTLADIEDKCLQQQSVTTAPAPSIVNASKDDPSDLAKGSVQQQSDDIDRKTNPDDDPKRQTESNHIQHNHSISKHRSSTPSRFSKRLQKLNAASGIDTGNEK